MRERRSFGLSLWKNARNVEKPQKTMVRRRNLVLQSRPQFLLADLAPLQQPRASPLSQQCCAFKAL